MLYVFNPEHDYALANNGPHFVPPESAIRFARDCAPFLLQLMGPEDILFQPYQNENRFISIKGDTVDKPDSKISVCPWGWDALVLKQLQSEGFCQDETWVSKVQKYREIAHRRTASAAMEFLRKHLPTDFVLPLSAQELLTISEAENFIDQHHNVIFKSPYSGNGRGHLYAHGECSPTLARQITGVIRRQGSIMAEPMYQIQQDFAMEFICHEQKTSFAGYSLFETRHYGYAANVLCSDSHIENYLSSYISIDKLHQIRGLIIDFLNDEIAPYYDGIVGIDMCLYEQDGIQLNPMIEINLRMTMGMAAHQLFERKVHPEAKGRMELVYRSKNGELKSFIQSEQETNPTIIEDSRWRSGFFVLNPVTDETQYAVCVWLS